MNQNIFLINFYNMIFYQQVIIFYKNYRFELFNAIKDMIEF